MTTLRLDIPGAIPPNPDIHDQGIAWHYGDPLREQRSLVAGDGIVDMSNRGVVSVTGPDRLTWLHDLTTQHMRDLKPGDSCLALILDPNGRVEYELHCADDGATTWIITQPGQAEPLVEYLTKMRFMLRVEVQDESSARAVVFEPKTENDPDHPTWIVPTEFAERGYRGREVILTADEATQRITANDKRAGSWAIEALRVAARMPRMHCETDYKTIPNEVGWLNNAVHLNKGCYRGQETVAKVHNLGKPPRRLAFLHLDGIEHDIVKHCDRIFLDDREIGWIGTGAIHFEEGPIALAVVKRNVAESAELVVRLDDSTESIAVQAPVEEQ